MLGCALSIASCCLLKSTVRLVMQFQVSRQQKHFFLILPVSFWHADVVSISHLKSLLFVVSMPSMSSFSDMQYAFSDSPIKKVICM